MAEEKICDIFKYRVTRAGAVDRTLVFIDGKAVEPTRKDRTKSGMMGQDVYCLSKDEWKKAIIVSVYRSMRGVKDILIKNLSNSDIAGKIVMYWLYSTSDPEELKTFIEKTLTEHR